MQPQLPEAGSNVDRKHVVTPVGAGDLGEDFPQLIEESLVFAHVIEKRFSGAGYRLTSARVSMKARTAISRSPREWAAETWVRILALPWGTTGYENPTT